MNAPPRKIVERGLYRPVWIEFNRLLDYVREISITSGRNVQRTRTLNGTLLVSESTRRVEPSEPGVVKQFLVTAVQNDYLECREYDGTSATGDTVLVAKPWRLRRTPFDGQTITFTDDLGSYQASFTYTSSVARTSRISSFEEQQVVIPRWLPDFDVIFASQSENGTGVSGADWQDLNLDGRAWARRRS